MPAKVRIYVASKAQTCEVFFVVLVLSSSPVERLSATIVALSALVLVTVWQGVRWSTPIVTQDFEECAELAENTAQGTQRAAMLTDCGARFAGRRKAGGGYTYYDFLQNRSFDIAGPNPTEEERKRIDLEYVGFLDSERRDAVSAELAKRHVENLLADFENARRPIGPPTILTPKNPPTPKSSVKKSTSCPVEGSLSCSWAKLRSAVKNAFASASKPGSGNLPDRTGSDP
jgi:hypothetical protein